MDSLRRLIFIFATTVLVLFLIMSYARAECLRSAQAVWNAHDGAHATWSMRHGEKCWYARGRQYKAVAKGEVVAIPLPRPAMRNSPVVQTVSTSPSTPRGLVRAEHDQFITWSTDSALDTDVSAFLFLQDRMIAAGWRLWLLASVERFQDAQARLLPLR